MVVSLPKNLVAPSLFFYTVATIFVIIVAMFGKIKENSTQEKAQNEIASLEHTIEALLFYTAKELSIKELSALSGSTVSDVKQSLVTLQNTYATRGITILVDKNRAVMVTSAKVADTIEKLSQDEQEKDLSKAALETLSVVAYHGPVTRMEIDYIRGVNSTYSLRNLMIRGLIDKVKDGQTARYTASIDTYKFMGVTAKEELPDYSIVRLKVEELLNRKESEEQQEQDQSELETKSHTTETEDLEQAS